MNKLLNVEQIESMDIEDVIYAYMNGYALEEYDINAMTYTTVDTKSCISTVAVSTAVSGVVTITKSCPTGVAPGTTVTVGATVTNTGTMNNNAFVIQCAVARSDTPSVVFASSQTGNLTLAPGATSAEFTLSFTMPPVNANVVFTAQANNANNY